MRNRHVTEQFGQVLERLNQLDAIRHDLGRLDAAIITRYPDSERAAESYEALRKAVMAAGVGTGRHIADLVALSSLIDEGANAEAVQLRIRDLLGVLGLRPLTIDECMQGGPEMVAVAFEVVGDSAHPRPAWIQETDRGVEVYRRGYISEPPTATPADINHAPAGEGTPEAPPASEAEKVPEVPSQAPQDGASTDAADNGSPQASGDSTKEA